MAIDPAKVALFVPSGLKAFKLELFEHIGETIRKAGGRVVYHDPRALAHLPGDVLPVVGCSPELADLIASWRKTGRQWSYWDRGYWLRPFASSLPWAPSLEKSCYRVHLNSFQLQRIGDFPDDRWKAMRTDVLPWRKNGRHIVIAAPSKTYARFHRCESWIADTIDALARVTDRQLVIRDKEHCRNRPLQRDLDGAHCLVAHGSIAAVESVILGCPVFVHPDSAASLVGSTGLSKVEKPVYPDRQPWLNALAYSQFNQQELCNGSVWRLLQ